MDRSAIFDAALERLMGDMDDMEGSSAMKHSVDECPDPMSCDQHDSELGENLTPAPKPAIAIEIKGAEPESMDEGMEAAEDKLSPEEAEELRKLLK